MILKYTADIVRYMCVQEAKKMPGKTVRKIRNCSNDSCSCILYDNIKVNGIVRQNKTVFIFRLDAVCRHLLNLLIRFSFQKLLTYIKAVLL